MTLDARKRLPLLIFFKDVVVDSGGIAELVRHDDWKPYIDAVLSRKRGLPERKTGLYVPNVETTGLVKDERGWLQLVVQRATSVR